MYLVFQLQVTLCLPTVMPFFDLCLLIIFFLCHFILWDRVYGISDNKSRLRSLSFSEAFHASFPPACGFSCTAATNYRWWYQTTWCPVQAGRGNGMLTLCNTCKLEFSLTGIVSPQHFFSWWWMDPFTLPLKFRWIHEYPQASVNWTFWTIILHWNNVICNVTDRWTS